MLELLNEAISPANLIYTILLGLAVLYALTVIVGFAGMDAIDFDVDIDADVDVDVDVDADTDINSGGIFISILSFFNIGKIPFMFIYSLCTLFMWVLGMLLNSNFGNGSPLFTVMTFIPVFFLSLTITKFVTIPLIPILKKATEGSEITDYIGLQGTLLLSLSNRSKGQAEVLIEGDVHRITVSLRKDDYSELEKGTEIYITGVSDDKSYYWIAKDDII